MKWDSNPDLKKDIEEHKKLVAELPLMISDLPPEIKEKIRKLLEEHTNENSRRVN